MVQATCLYNGCLPCTDENNLVNQHQSGFLVQCSNHKGQTETDWHKPSSTDTTLTLHAWYSSLPSDPHEEMQQEYPFAVTYALQSSELLCSELYTKYCTISILTCSNSNQLGHKENKQYRNVTRVCISS